MECTINEKLPGFNSRIKILGLMPNQQGLETLASIAGLDADKLITEYQAGKFNEATVSALFALFKDTLPKITKKDIPKIFSPNTAPAAEKTTFDAPLTIVTEPMATNNTGIIKTPEVPQDNTEE